MALSLSEKGLLHFKFNIDKYSTVFNHFKASIIGIILILIFFKCITAIFFNVS